uniref:Uncharacterized protein n=1 Tax=Hucho hucho TaxID=62062 RepID=A0A4W5RRE1_9TELE
MVQAPRLPKAGETIHGHKFFIGFGGIGANQCIPAARIEAKTAMVCKLSVPSSSFHWATSSCVTSAGEIAIVIVAALIHTIFNPAPAIPDLDSDFYRASDVFCCNESEAELLTGADVASIEDVGWLDRSLGSWGSVVLSAQEPSSLSIRVPTKPLTTVDTTIRISLSLICAMAFYMVHFPTMPLEDGRRANQVA